MENVQIDIKKFTLRQLRRYQGFTCAEIAKELNITKQGYSLKELNKRPLTKEELSKLSEVFNLDVNTLNIIVKNEDINNNIYKYKN